MSQNRLAADTWLMLAITVCGLWLRFASLNALCVEHFDEGVYASTLWYNDDFGTDYPGRDFYAPPLLPTMIAAGQATLGDHLAPFWFSLLTGTLTIPVIWWFTRSFFGKAAGLFAATTIALSDYHIIYSRMAMTDVPALLFTLLAIGLALRGINSISTRHMAAAGFCCGLAWWTKYTGWLPLAVVGSGSMVWWFWKGRRRIRFVSLCRLQLTMAATTLITFSPWWMALQDVGGLSAVSQNQAGYVSGFSVWTSQLATQLANQKLLDGRFGHIALLAGMLIAGVWRWKKAAGSTWNAACPQSPRTAGTLPTTPGADPQPTAVEMPPWRVVTRFAMAGLTLMLLAPVIWTTLLLLCLALGGFAGALLWPVLDRAWYRRTSHDLSPTAPDAIPLVAGDLEVAPTSDPALGLSATFCWFAALLTVTPLYHPYPRLMMPLLAAVWLSAAAGVGWWFESNLSVARRQVFAGTVPKRSIGRMVANSLWMVAVLLCVINLPADDTSPIHENHRSIRTAAINVATQCVRAARGESNPPTTLLPSGSVIKPSGADADLTVQRLAQAEAAWQELKFNPAEETIVVYAMAEPALLLHLRELGLHVAPVADVSFSKSTIDGHPVPTFLVFGPNARATPDFLRSWVDGSARRFQTVGRSGYFPGRVVLLNLYSPSTAFEQLYQPFEIFRLQE